MFPNVAGKVSKIRTENYLAFRFHNLWVMNGFTRTVPIKLGDKSLTEMDSKKNGREGCRDSEWRQLCRIIAGSGSREMQ